jgi:Protein of unknown function (DUF1266)
MGLFDRVKKAFSYEFNVLEGAPNLTPEQARGLALGAVYAAEGDLPINALTTGFDSGSTRSVLSQAWDVAGPADVESAYANLVGSGHRGYYEIVHARVDALFTQKRREAAKLAGQHETEIRQEAESAGLDPATAMKYYQAWGASASVGGHAELIDPLPQSIAAWDAARVVHVSRLVVDSGYATAEDVWPHIANAVDFSRSAHRSWAEFGSAFLVGRAFWRSGLGHHVDNDLAPFKLAVDNLTKTPGSPWLDLPY